MSTSVILVANPKGGVGKSTLATNIAGLLAARSLQYTSLKVMLGDVDRQQSSRAWLASRPETAATIHGWELNLGKPARPPKGTSHVVLDTPAGLHGEKLKALLRLATSVIVPLQPSVFDIEATRGFLDALAETKAARGLPVALVGMRVDARTRSFEQLTRFVESTNLSLLSALRNTQNYVQLASQGLTLFDLPRARVEKDLAQWSPIEHWLLPF